MMRPLWLCAARVLTVPLAAQRFTTMQAPDDIMVPFKLLQQKDAELMRLYQETDAKLSEKDTELKRLYQEKDAELKDMARRLAAAQRERQRFKTKMMHLQVS